MIIGWPVRRGYGVSTGTQEGISGGDASDQQVPPVLPHSQGRAEVLQHFCSIPPQRKHNLEVALGTRSGSTPARLVRCCSVVRAVTSDRASSRPVLVQGGSLRRLAVGPRDCCHCQGVRGLAVTSGRCCWFSG
jgi:hypothetical protein